MTTVTINFSQATLSTLETYRATHVPLTLAGEFDKLIKAGYNFSSTHAVYTGGSLAGPDGYLDYPDGSFQTFSGLVNTTPGAASGTFSAGSLEDHISGNYRLVYDGQLNFGYSTSASNGLLLSNKGGTINTLTLQQLITAGTAGYDNTIGNTVLKAHGSVTSSDGNLFSGVVDTLTRTTELFEEGGRITGDFTVSGNSTAIGQGSASTAFGGTLSSYAQYYTDGSSALISAAAIAVTGSTVANEQQLLANAANFGGDDSIAVTLPAIVNTNWLIASGAGDDRISITGGGARLSVDAGSGKDIIVMNDYGHAIDGGAGIDTAVFAGNRAAYAVTGAGGGFSVRAAAGGSANTLSNVERIQFADGGLALDVNGNAGQLYRLYQSAFNRAPDAAGAGFWLTALDNGTTLKQIIGGFSTAQEFINLYGVNTNFDTLVTALYVNALDRQPEAAGKAYWINALEHGLSVVDMVLEFSESPESHTLNAGLIANGFAYTPYG
ncbi:DUF4214 domain-containing protein [Pseudoduganella aquatica]|uniref:DUF4214 domain-containing protein n=1 Tax=Pseudoduganella aquatica TaxID=2660641 RepID=A0A7X4KLA1_9BURK|nr:DUF4214 domain-containing protein [Pseudoduganella aquatica]MYN06565.1 DUF4214 domain-containing protein [Pseudoduganella aquatica]